MKGALSNSLCVLKRFEALAEWSLTFGFCDLNLLWSCKQFFPEEFISAILIYFKKFVILVLVTE